MVSGQIVHESNKFILIDSKHAQKHSRKVCIRFYVCIWVMLTNLLNQQIGQVDSNLLDWKHFHFGVLSVETCWNVVVVSFSNNLDRKQGSKSEILRKIFVNNFIFFSLATYKGGLLHTVQ